MNNTKCRILIISDLHYDDTKNTTVDNKTEFDEIAEFTEESREARFVKSVMKACGNTEKDFPNVLIIAGDLVHKGGHDLNKFIRPIKFIKYIISELNIKKDYVCVVPGNHDVDWECGPSYVDRFSNYLDAVDPFKSPYIRNGKSISTELVDLSKIAGINIELLLMASPTFSGVSSKESDKIVEKMRDSFAKNIKDEGEKEEFKRVLDIIKERKDVFDIAAIGGDQIKEIEGEPINDSIKIAVLHHHLISDVNITIAPFESVVDSGRVLKVLVEKGFDLAIHGHKHNPALHRYELNDLSIDNEVNSYIDIFSSPSLSFSAEEKHFDFTIIDIYDDSSPHYAEIQVYGGDAGRSIGKSKKLIREGRVLKDIYENCKMISTENQEEYLVSPIIHIGEMLSKKKKNAIINHPKLIDFFNKSYKYSLKRLKLMANEKILLESPDGNKDWQNFMQTMNKLIKKKSLRIVSENDFDFWKDSMVTDEENPAVRYSQVLKDFEVDSKERVWILPKDKYENPTTYKKIIKIAEHMKSMGFKVYLVDSEKAKEANETDFSIIGELCISQWLNMKDGNRELVESFNKDEISQRIEDFNYLKGVKFRTL